jgi:hypothetical protein
VIQSLTSDVTANVTSLIEDAKAAIFQANQTSGVNQTTITLANGKVEDAESKVASTERDGSTGLHNPEKTFRILNEAALLVIESKSLALEALRQAETATLEAQVTSVEDQVNNMQNIALGGTTGALIIGLLIGILIQRYRK